MLFRMLRTLSGFPASFRRVEIVRMLGLKRGADSIAWSSHLRACGLLRLLIRDLPRTGLPDWTSIGSRPRQAPTPNG